MRSVLGAGGVLVAMAALGCGHAPANRRLENIIEQQHELLASLPDPLPSHEEIEKRKATALRLRAETVEHLRSDPASVHARLEGLGCSVLDDRSGGGRVECHTADASEVGITDFLYQLSFELLYRDIRVTMISYDHTKSVVSIEYVRVLLPVPSADLELWPAPPSLDEILADGEGGRWDLVLRARGGYVELRDRDASAYVDMQNREVEMLNDLSIADEQRDAAVDLFSATFHSVIRGNLMYVKSFSFSAGEDGRVVAAFVPHEGAKVRVLERMGHLTDAAVEGVDEDEAEVRVHLAHRPTPRQD